MSSRPAPDPELFVLQKALAGRFSLERELGRGGMGAVYLAQDVALDRPVALKLLPPAFAAQPALRERFVQEARTAAKLSHPNIVPIYQVDEVDGFVFFVMAFVHGQTLGQRVRERGQVPPREAAGILREVAWALAYAHGQGVVHRDIKPDNILLEAGSGRALVTDFGIARAGAAAGLTTVGEILGTPEYMSPEQASGEDVDGRSDLYALGAVAHYMLSGKLPLQGSTPQATLAKQLTQPAPALLSVAPEVPAPLARAVDRCLEKDPAARVQDGAELADVLGRVLQDRREVPVPIRVFQEQNRDAAGPIALIVLMLLAAVTSIVFMVVEGIPVGDGIPGLLTMGALSLVAPAILGVMARRLLKAGYGHDELVRALRTQVEERRGEIASQAGEETAIDVWAPRVGWLGVALFLVGMVGILLPSMPIAVIEALMFTGMPLSILGGGAAAIRGHVRKLVPGTRWLAFWDNAVGSAIFRLAGLGLDRAEAIGGSYRPTEMAIGMAAERLFEELPRDVRRSLGDVPAVLKQLEAHAERMRARVKELDGVLVAVGEHAARVDAGAAADRRDAVGEEVRRTRAAAEERLREVVAALETLRLELLRLHAGSGDVESVTMDLAAARALAEEVGFRAEGQREVEAMLGRPVPGLPEPADTPQPV